MTTLIKNIGLYRNGKVTENQNISLNGKYIKDFPENPKDEDYEEVIDGKGMLAIPGLVNTHTHVAMTLFRSYADDMELMDWLQNKIWPAEDHLDDDIVYWGSMLAFAEMIRGGTTAFCDMYMFMDSCAKAADKAGIRGNLARGLAGISPNAQSGLQENIELFEKWEGAGDGRFHVMLGPHAPYTCPPDYIRQVRDEAMKRGIPIHIHLSETKGEVENCLKEYGKTPIALMNDLGLFELPTLAAHCVHVTDKDIAIMQEKHVRVAHNPGSNLKLASGCADVLGMVKAGMNVCLGTDSVASNNNLDLFEEIKAAALMAKGKTGDPKALPAEAALMMATVCGARAQGRSAECGVIELGMDADLILLDFNQPHLIPCHNVLSHLVYAASGHDVALTMVRGKILYADGKYPTLDIAGALKELHDYAIPRVFSDEPEAQA